MKKFLLTIVAIVMVAIVFAQSPNAFKYQAIARDASGNIIQNQNVGFRISILENGSDVYSETFVTTTNNYGLVNLEIGNGNIAFGDFSLINWSNNTFSIKIELDVNGGTAYELMGTSDLLSVPYALHAKTAENVFSGNYADLTNTPDLSNYDNDATDDFSGDYSDLINKPTLVGDVTGDISANTVEKIQGMTVSSNIPANGQVLKWNSISQTWEPNDDALGAAGTTDGVVTSVSFSGTTTKTITLMRSNGLGDLTAIFTDEVNDADSSPTNEIQDISLIGTDLSITNGSTIDLSVIQDGYDANTDEQTLSLSGNTLSISNGNNIDLSVFLDNTDTQLSETEVDSYVSNNGYLTIEVDGSTTNEIQDLSLTGNILKITNNASATEIDLAPFSGTNTDEQTLSFSGTDLSISGGNTVDLSSLVGSANTDEQTLSLSGNTLSISNGNNVDLSAYLDNTDTHLSEAEVDSYVSNNGYLTSFTEVDGSTTNEIQDITLSGTNLSISNGSTVDLSGLTGVDTDDQTLSLSGTVLTITDGNSVNLGLIDTDTQLSETEVDTYVSNNGYLTSEVDGSTTNEIQDLILTGSTLKITNNSTATEIDLSPFAGTNTDEQTLTLSGNSLSISNGNSVDLSSIGGTDTDDQTLSLSGTVLTIADGNSVNLSSIDTDTQLSEAEVDTYVGNNGFLTSFTEVDGSITNEIQDLSISGNTLSLSGDASTVSLTTYLDNTDSQSLTLSGSSLSISGGNTVNLSSIDTDTQLSEAEVDAYVSDNGYLTTFTEVDGSTTNELQDITLTGTNLSISNGSTIDLSSIDTDTQLSETEVDAYVADNGYLTSEVDGSTTNEIQDLSISGNTLSLSSDASTVNLATYLDNTDGQTLSLSGSSLTISGGNSVDLSSLAGGTDTDDQTLSLSGTTLTIADGNSVSLSSINTDDQTLIEILTASPNAGYNRISQVNTPADDWDVANKIYVDTRTLGNILSNNTSAGNNRITFLATPIALEDAATKGYVDGKVSDDQTLSLSGTTLSIADGNSVDLSSLGGGTDTDDQTLSLSGTSLTIADGNSVDLSSIDTKLNETQVDAYVSNNGYLTSELDNSTTNELQSLSLSGTNLTISSGNTVSLSSLAGTDDQTLSEVLTSGTDAGNKNIVNVAQAGIGTASPNASAALEISSTTQGFLPPRMTEAQMLAIPPVQGLTVFNTTRLVLTFYNGNEWRNIDNTPYLYVGKSYKGGIVAYILQPIDPGYVADEVHGLIATANDLSASATWGCNTIFVGTNSGLGQGQTSTTNIVTACATAGIAARICDDLVEGGYSDWFLPSKDELYKLYVNRATIGGFVSSYYWSSTQYSTDRSFYYSFLNGVPYDFDKLNPRAVRAVRYF